MDKFLGHTPPSAPLQMPTQSLTDWRGPVTRIVNSVDVVMARIFVFSVSILLIVAGTYGMYQVISPVNVTWLQVLFASLFAITFAWIAFACASAVWGFWVLMRRKQKQPVLADIDRMGRTALLMPVYNEDPHRVFAGLRSIAAELIARDAASHFDIFVLSDTRKDDVARVEHDCFMLLKEALAGRMGLYYRRREDNHHRKAGNIADFVTRWGGAYDHMIVLDADSSMSADTLITLARAMAADPQAGIIQTLPLLFNRWTPFARMTQFAGRVYGPVIAAGLSAWHGRDGNYWGHNAIIRTRAFAEAAGLPELPGRKPFGGHILSHDFIEAALMRRAGYAVYMLPDLGGSYEETPPNLMELAGRDRRWAQGNLQHVKILRAKGLHWASRLHLLQGIMSYLASPLWLMLLVAGLCLTTVARYATPNYFPEGFSLFPVWPVFDPELALKLFAVTGVVLFLPKILGLLLALRDREIRRGCGGTIGLIKSFIAEIFVSMLLSPVMMLIQTGFVIDVLLGRDSGWNNQNREDSHIPFKPLLVRHAPHVMMGLIFGGLSFLISWAAFLWFLPIALALIVSPVVVWATGIPALGRWLHRANVFRIPEEGKKREDAVLPEAPSVPEEKYLQAAE